MLRGGRPSLTSTPGQQHEQARLDSLSPSHAHVCSGSSVPSLITDCRLQRRHPARPGPNQRQPALVQQQVQASHPAVACRHRVMLQAIQRARRPAWRAAQRGRLFYSQEAQPSLTPASEVSLRPCIHTTICSTWLTRSYCRHDKLGYFWAPSFLRGLALGSSLCSSTYVPFT